MYKLFVFVVLLFMVFSLTSVAYAQEPTAEPGPPVFTPPVDLPETAAGGLEVVQAFILFVGGLATYYVTNALKKLPGLSGDNTQKISGLAAEALAAVTAFVVGLVLAYGAMVAGFLDDNGFWAVVQWVWVTWPVAFTIHKGNKLATAK